MRRLLSLTLIVSFFMLPLSPLWADATSSYLSGIPLAVVPVHDGDGDAVSDELTQSLRAALAQQAGIHVVDSQRVAEVMAYHETSSSSAVAQTLLASTTTQITRAKEHYLQFASDEAAAEIEQALQVLRASPLSLTDKGQALRDALVTGIIIQGDLKRGPRLNSYFDELLRLDPQFSPADKSFSPSLKVQLAQRKAALKSAPTGSLQVSTSPKVAEVYVNGILKGVTPLTLSDLPLGTYDIKIATNRYQPWTQSVTVQATAPTVITQDLKWQKKNPQPSATSIARSDALAQIQEGNRLTDVLRIQKLVLVDVDQHADGSGVISARMLDGTTKASHRPIHINYSPNKSRLPQDMAQLLKLVTAQATLKRLDNPLAQLDPQGLGDPVVLGERRKRRGLTPVQWGVVGGVAGAGALAGILAAVLSASSSDASTATTGSLNVQLR